jgi:hypothetical protein
VTSEELDALVPTMRARSRWLATPFYVVTGGALVAGVYCAVLALVALLAGGGPGGIVALALALALGALLGLAVASIPQTIRVGRDGVSFRWLRGERFHSFGDVEGFVHEQTPQGERRDRGWLVKRAGARIRVSPASGDGGARAEGVYRAIDDALAAYRTAASSALVGPDLGRGGRDDAAWLAGLRQLAAAGEPYRGAAVDRARLIATVENAALDPSERAAAAYLLRDAMTDVERARVRVAAASSVAPKVRAALEAAAGGADVARAEDALTRIPISAPGKRDVANTAPATPAVSRAPRPNQRVVAILPALLFFLIGIGMLTGSALATRAVLAERDLRAAHARDWTPVDAVVVNLTDDRDADGERFYWRTVEWAGADGERHELRFASNDLGPGIGEHVAMRYDPADSATAEFVDGSTAWFPAALVFGILGIVFTWLPVKVVWAGRRREKAR